mmetsp:Transcript_7682/g.18741  ORF Transcript_7682/g.18741 Transcript_7682/m.18741 type:complete len:233 (+) Transcript_7682:507-1205(+)
MTTAWGESFSPAGYTARAMSSSAPKKLEVDQEYPGTAVKRMNACMERAKSLDKKDLNQEWEDVRRKILWAGGLKDLPNARPGYGYTGHSFNDWNHCDLTTMLGDVSHNENKGEVSGIAIGNQLGPGIQIASLPELGPGGSWSTCMMGCNKDPPQDVAHIQFKSRIAFKLVWCPPNFSTFVLVDDAGNYLNHGTPGGRLPDIRERAYNYKVVQGSKYAKEAERIGKEAVKEAA